MPNRRPATNSSSAGSFGLGGRADVVRVKAGLPAYFTMLGEPSHRYETTLRAIEPVPEVNQTDTKVTTATATTTATTTRSLVVAVAGPVAVRRFEKSERFPFIFKRAPISLFE